MVTHDLPLIATIAVSFSCAFFFGLIAAKLRLPAIVGYMVAGMVVGPYTPGFVADMKIAEELAEIGVIFLMFGVGLHFSIKDLLKVKKIAIPGAIVQIAVATSLGMVAAHIWGWSLMEGFLLGLSLSVASTVVLLRALEEQDAIRSLNGKIAVGWLIVEDLFMILVLVLLPAIAQTVMQTDHAISNTELMLSLGVTIGKIIAFVCCMLFLGGRFLPWLLTRAARTGSRELFTVAVFAVAMGIAFGASYLFGVSLALGAFFAGMMLKESDWRHRVSENVLPFQDAFAVLFFVSVGMLFNAEIIMTHPWHLVVVVMIILFGKAIAAFLIITLFRYPLDTALIVSISLMQIGEFSFILANLGKSYGMLPAEGYSLILAGALITITLNPIIFKLIAPFYDFISQYPKLLRLFRIHRSDLSFLQEKKNGEIDNRIIIVGYGRVGRYLCDSLKGKKINIVVVDHSIERITAVKARKINTVIGDGVRPEILAKASIETAKAIVIVIPNIIDAKEVARVAKELNSNIAILVRGKNEDELKYFTDHSVALALMGEKEIAHHMGDYLTTRFHLE